jgi:4,5-DOPA dioxygenase extradiol
MRFSADSNFKPLSGEASNPQWRTVRIFPPGMRRECDETQSMSIQRFFGNQDHSSGPMKCIEIHDSARLGGPGFRESAVTPAIFIGHGSPMNALERNVYTQAWRAFGQRIVRPRAVLVISAHWYVGVRAVTAMPRPKTIHDFYGFPEALFAVQYPAPGDPALAEEIAEIVKPMVVGLDHDSWGIDHGAWSVLTHLFPAADIPVVQLSIDARKPHEDHFELGAKLGALRRKGVLILGSGNVVHNLRLIDWNRPWEGFDWVRRFDEATRNQMIADPSLIPTLREHPDYQRAVPTPEHFLPLVYLAGAAASVGSGTDVFLEGYAYGSLSMTAYSLGAGAMEPAHGGASAPLADTNFVNPEDSNA